MWRGSWLMVGVSGDSSGPANDFTIGELDSVLLRVRWSIPVRRAIQINKSGLAVMDHHWDVLPSEMSGGSADMIGAGRDRQLDRAFVESLNVVDNLSREFA